MSLYQKTREAFKDLVSNTMHHNKWRPDEYFIRLLREMNVELGRLDPYVFNKSLSDVSRVVLPNTDKYLSIESNLRSLTFHDGTEKKIKFYRVTDPARVTPNMKEVYDQAFWEECWDELRGQYPHPLSRKLTKHSRQENDETIPASSKRICITPPPKEKPDPPQDFETARKEIVDYFRSRYSRVPESIHFISQSEVQKLKTSDEERILRAARANELSVAQANTREATGDETSHLYTKVAKTRLAKLETAEIFLFALLKVLRRKKNVSTHETRTLFGALASSRTHIATKHLVDGAVIGRHTLLLETVDAFVHLLKSRRGTVSDTKLPKCITDISYVSKSAPSISAVQGWVVDLAVLQVFLKRRELEGHSICVQQDGGQKGQNNKLLTYFDGADTRNSAFGTAKEIPIDPKYCGKSAAEEAQGMKEALSVFGIKKIRGFTVDSGAGTPESTYNAYSEAGLIDGFCFAQSCGLHNLMSCFRLPTQHFIGGGGLGERNAVQLLHTAFACWEAIKPRIPSLLPKLWAKSGGAPEDLPRELVLSLQEPLITRWWTISVLASFVKRNRKIIRLVALAIHNDSKGDTKENTLACNFISLVDEKWIFNDVMFLAGIGSEYLDKYMRWYQDGDSQFGFPGLLTHHSVVAYYLQANTIKEIKRRCMTDMPGFEEFRQSYNDLKPEEQVLKAKQVEMYLSMMLSQVHKHNKRQLTTDCFLQAAFGEKATGTLVAKILQSGNFEQPPAPEEVFKSEKHGCEIKLLDFHSFLKTNLPLDTLGKIRGSNAFDALSPTIIRIANEDIDIWSTAPGDENATEVSAIRFTALEIGMIGSNMSTQHNNERLVGAGALAAKNKGEGSVYLHLLARLDFKSEYSIADYEFFYPTESEEATDTASEEDDGDQSETEEDDNDETEQEQEVLTDDSTPPSAKFAKRRRGYLSSYKYHCCFSAIANAKLTTLSELKSEMGEEAYKAEISDIRKLVTLKDTLQIRHAEEKVETMMEQLDNPRKTLLTAARKRGFNFPARVLGYFPIYPMRQGKLANCLKAELRARGLQYNDQQTNTQNMIRLKEHEAKRYESLVDEALQERNLSLTGNSKTLSAKLAVLTDHSDKKGEYLTSELRSIDITKMFKKIAPDSEFDSSVFDEL